MSRWAGLILLTAICGCAKPPVEYRPVPLHLIPGWPQLPTVRADELRCLSDDAYLRLVERDRMLRQNNDELRALLGAQ